MGDFEHWQRETGDDGICWLRLDKAGSSANTLSGAVMRELDEILRELAFEPPRGVVFASAKPSGFIFGADVTEISHITSAIEGTRLSAAGQVTFLRIAELDCPTVAAINGIALGGGLELALACDYRVTVRGYERNLGLPEVQLGIHPGFGGTVRLVRLLGAPRALDLMLTGRSLSPVEAHDAGLVDRLATADGLEEAARELIRARPSPRRAPLHLRVLNAAPVRGVLAKRIRRTVAARARQDQYPAPYAILDLWARHGASGPEAYAAEADSLGRLIVSRTSKNLVRVFQLRERLRHLAPKDDSIRRVHVVGAGVMGGDIAAWCALRGLRVTVQDRAMEFVTPALERALSLFAKRLKEPGAAEAAAARLTVDLAAKEVGAADLVIEAIVEKLEAKTALFRELEPKLAPDAIVATNTSSIMLEEMAPAFSRPGRFVGLHFFNPVASLPLVEVIRGRETDEATLRRALAFVTSIGKIPLPCASAPGFVVNRILMPYMLEALRAHEDGVALETIDAAATSFGMPVGPIELADRVGLDVALHVARILREIAGGDAPALLEAKVAAGELGVKTGNGFYRYRDDRAEKRRDAPPPDRDLEDRLILPLVNEAVACLDDGVVEDADLLDAGVVLGTGFAPFTGGPINYARQRGTSEVIARLEELAKRYGRRFEPRPGWARIAAEA
ncbi:MAG TPA: 3-hydroxyacyl-CoA dehydrogenase NAD-binding domain-containing protein [Gammaproteobacteria bacterium]|nr:3-hydroxyacyl-CoA dehydrogenase NAD-binding domain-containing protein [Gammaproteobacteria bacterium]